MNQLRYGKLGKWGKLFTVVGISITIAFSGIPFIPETAPTAHAAYSATKADRIIKTGNRYLGVRYQFGAPAGSTRSFDCSSFTQYVFKKNGIVLPRTSRQQVKVGTYVKKSNLRKGDLVFFSTASSKGKVAHVGIYAGNNKVLHTYGKGGVKYSSMTSDWWKSHYITARRVIR
jgi:murein DD-endopeptidase / murein LD-carboxypeptidase